MRNYEKIVMLFEMFFFLFIENFYFFILQVYVEQVEFEEDDKMQERNFDFEFMFRRNLEIIVEVIRYLEGDRLGFNERIIYYRGIFYSDESEKESSVICSESEDRDFFILFEKIDFR